MSDNRLRELREPAMRALGLKTTLAQSAIRAYWSELEIQHQARGREIERLEAVARLLANRAASWREVAATGPLAERMTPQDFYDEALAEVLGREGK